MGDVLIRGIEMPNAEGCEVIIRIQPNGEVLDAHKIHIEATAVPLPAKHGKIIDADKLWENMTVEQSKAFQKGLAGTIELFEILEAAEAIVPADGLEEGEESDA